MSRLSDQFHEDRALRDAARAVVLADIAHAKHTLSRQGLTERVTGRISDGAKDIFEVAKGHADENRGIIAGVIALLALWFARGPLSEIFGFSSQSAAHEADKPTADEPTAGSHKVETSTPVTPNPKNEPSCDGVDA